MSLSIADLIWNRAALESGGRQPRDGDRALADALALHGLVMNGGVHHAVETLAPLRVEAAAAGFTFFGLKELAEFLGDRVLLDWTTESERAADQRYRELLPTDSHLCKCFERFFAEQPDQFAPLDE